MDRITELDPAFTTGPGESNIDENISPNSMNNAETAALEAKIARTVEDTLKEKYFLIRRSAWWAFLGGVTAFSVAVGFVSYNRALVAFSYPEVQAARTTVLNAQAESKTALTTIRANLQRSGVTESRFKGVESDLATLYRDLSPELGPSKIDEMRSTHDGDVFSVELKKKCVSITDQNYTISAFIPTGSASIPEWCLTSSSRVGTINWIYCSVESKEGKPGVYARVNFAKIPVTAFNPLWSVKLNIYQCGADKSAALRIGPM